MDSTDKKEFAKCMMVLNECFSGSREVTGELVEIYYQALSTYDIERIKEATNIMVATWSYNCMPKPADLIKAIDGTIDEVSLNEWYGVVKALKEQGTYVSVSFENKAVNWAVDACGGWIALGNCTDKELVWKQKEFERAYKAYRGNAPDHLIGRLELNNTHRGIKTEVKMLGNKEQNKLTE